LPLIKGTGHHYKALPPNGKGRANEDRFVRRGKKGVYFSRGEGGREREKGERVLHDVARGKKAQGRYPLENGGPLLKKKTIINHGTKERGPFGRKNKGDGSEGRVGYCVGEGGGEDVVSPPQKERECMEMAQPSYDERGKSALLLWERGPMQDKTKQNPVPKKKERGRRKMVFEYSMKGKKRRRAGDQVGGGGKPHSSA